LRKIKVTLNPSHTFCCGLVHYACISPTTVKILWVWGRDVTWQSFRSMSSLRGRLVTSIWHDCFLVKAAIATFVVHTVLCKSNESEIRRITLLFSTLRRHSTNFQTKQYVNEIFAKYRGYYCSYPERIFRPRYKKSFCL